MSQEKDEIESSTISTIDKETSTSVVKSQNPIILDTKALPFRPSDLPNSVESTVQNMEANCSTSTETDSKNNENDASQNKNSNRVKPITVVDLTNSPKKSEPSILTAVPEKPVNLRAGQLQLQLKKNLLSVIDGKIGGTSSIDEKKPSTSNPVVKKTPQSAKRYVYKLKAKSGRVLQYTSNVPIVLKKPVIKLTKMDPKAEYSSKVAENEADDLDSDNSMKENNVKNEGSVAQTPARVVKKRGRPPLSQRTPVITLDDRNSSDTADSKEEPKKSSFTMQTRKRQLKFLPDGRLVTPGKKSRESDAKTVESDTLSSDSDMETDEEPQGTKKFSPVVQKANEKKKKFKKVFDYESFAREKTGSPLSEGSETTKPKSSLNKIVEIQKNNSGLGGAGTPTKKPMIDPAQLLSSLIGVPIANHQLNIVKFKPKIIQERTPHLATTKRLNWQETGTPKLTTLNSELLKNTPYKVVSKQTFQKILPKPITFSSDKGTQVVKISPETKVTSTPVRAVTSISSKPSNSEKSVDDTITKFGNFSDTRIVKTKGGPKKQLQKKGEGEGETPKTVYDLVANVFDQMPSWNLHVIPDTNSLCIAQVSRGRMGIPILKKSIELNSEFFAKVYVHQLHCKRYDGIYDTESKILMLIRDIDALAA